MIAPNQRRWLICFVVWLLVGLPFVPIMWLISQPWSPWPKGALLAAVMAVLLTAILGTSLFAFLNRWWAFAGGILGGFSSWLILRLLSHLSTSLLPVTGYEILPWCAIAGIISGGLWRRLRLVKAGFLLDETNFLWTTVAAWIAVLRIFQIFVADVLINHDALFGEEILVFFPVLLFSAIGAGVLYRFIRAGSGRLILRSITSAFLIQELAGALIFPLMILGQGQAGTRGAFGLLCLIPGPGILWGILVGNLLSRLPRESAPSSEGPQQVAVR